MMIFMKRCSICNKYVLWVKYLICQNCSNIVCSRHPQTEFKYYSINLPGPGGFDISYNYPNGKPTSKGNFLCSLCRKFKK